MIYLIILILLLIYVFYLYKNSNSDFFHKSKTELNIRWVNLILPLLENYCFSYLDMIRFRESYNFFIENPSEFDGATIVKDITQIKNLDISAMAHDFAYIHSNNIKDRLKADWQYSQDMRKFNVPWTIAYSRMALLFFINLTGIYNLTKVLTKFKN